MEQHPFKKFINKKSNAAIKEQFRQEKRAAKKKRAAAIEERRSRKFTKPVQEPYRRDKKIKAAPEIKKSETEPMPLNKFLSHCGIASRRAAVDLIKKGLVRVNGVIVENPAHRISADDEVVYERKKLSKVHNLVYVLLNKPKDFITTNADPRHRKTVLQLVRTATDERIYPVGRLDRNTSGVLLLTNDGELTQQLTHPSFNIEKIYEVKLDKPLTRAHFSQILKGLKLDDGEIHADDLGYPDSNDKSLVGIELHSGRNRIVRRIFESLGYEIKHLDRVVYAGLTKKDVDRGRWRYLSEKEISDLKYMTGKSKRRKKRS